MSIPAYGGPGDILVQYFAKVLNKSMKNLIVEEYRYLQKHFSLEKLKINVTKSLSITKNEPLQWFHLYLNIISFKIS